MHYFWIIVVMAVSFFFGAIGFPQIIGSLQTRQHYWYITILLWVVILAGIHLLIIAVLPWCKTACFIGIGIALLAALSTGTVQ